MRDNKVLRIILCIIAIVFIVHQIYSSTYKPITTVSAEYQTVIEGFPINVMIIREEKVVESNTKGALHFTLVDGERVSKNGVIANIYSDAKTSVTVNRIEQLESRIKDIEEMQSYNDVEATDIKLINNKVNNSLNTLIRGIASGDFSSVEVDSAELLTNISRRQMITGEETDFSARLDKLNLELEQLRSTVLSCNEIDALTPERLDSINKGNTPQNAIGKIVSGYTWYIAASVNISDSLKYKVGDKLTLQTTLKSTPHIDVKVEKINTSQEKNEAVIIFSCDQMNSELASIRQGNMTIINNTYSGLKLPAKAMRFKDEKAGVFVRSGMTIKFVEVNVIYKTDEYFICEQQVSNDSVLRLYDDVVVKGKNLYDGKIID